ncbi:hypothetical protein [Subtercola endophyticus]|uniref:hypothetical protein n=1 Tax=Subtercola endophyticus TaxID=2895559 RepID=UPI001E49ED1D|nr:hypothetical protein [Subtercola endophyticus]UFS59184.1 hypothetical protein LQ955_19780 [Subtercola endophyticus]
MTEITRRTALKAAAWSTPVVALAVSAPAAAAASATPVYSIYQPHAGWGTDGVFTLEAYVRQGITPVDDVVVTWTLNPGSLIYTATTYGDEGFANKNPTDVPDSVTTATISAEDATVTIPVTDGRPV